MTTLYPLSDADYLTCPAQLLHTCLSRPNPIRSTVSVSPPLYLPVPPAYLLPLIQISHLLPVSGTPLALSSLRFNRRLYPTRVSCLARTFNLRPLTQPIQPPASHSAANTQFTQHTLSYVCLSPFSAPNTSRTPKNAYFHNVVSAPLSPPSTTITLTSKSDGIFGADLTNRWGSLPD